MHMQTSVVEKQITFASIAISDLGQTATHEIAKELRPLLADTFALYMKTKNFHWYVTTLRSIGDIGRDQRLQDNDREGIAPADMLLELLTDNQQFIQFLRIAHELCDQNRDVATARLIENWIDQAERGSWFLAEVGAGAA
jgi:starvation-inducible DNA-binding protein